VEEQQHHDVFAIVAWEGYVYEYGWVHTLVLVLLLELWLLYQ